VLAPRDIRERTREAYRAVAGVLGIPVWPDVPVAWNRRLRRAGRAVIHGSGRTFLAATIELSPAYFEVYPQDLAGILVHEAVHVGLAVMGRDFGHTPEFRRVCRTAGGLQHGRALPGRVFHYRCPVCGDTLERRRRLTSDRWCARCAAAATRDPTVDPYAADRCLVLVGTAFSGTE
jgi:predicted SprT family Zn-dependent metalloprotease